jgi:hypothetical protein
MAYSVHEENPPNSCPASSSPLASVATLAKMANEGCENR